MAFQVNPAGPNSGVYGAQDLPFQQTQFGQMAADRAAKERANIAAGAQMYPATLQQERFNTVFPWMQSQFASLSRNKPTAGNFGTPPEITVGGVLNPQQIQQQVNQSRAANDAATQTQIRAMQQRLGGTGMGAQSPLAQALSGQLQSGNLATNTQQETDLRLGAAQKNAQQLLGTQQARLGGWEAAGQLQNERLKALMQPQLALINALGGLV